MKKRFLTLAVLICVISSLFPFGMQVFAGPAPAPISRMRGYFRYNVLLKGKDRTAMCALLRKVLGSIRKPHGVLIAVDVDPISM